MQTVAEYSQELNRPSQMRPWGLEGHFVPAMQVVDSTFILMRQDIGNVAIQSQHRFEYRDYLAANKSGLSSKDKELEGRFEALSRQWKRETGHFSVIARRYQHPAYKSILEMKSAVVPLILKELRREPDRWFAALQALTGENPAKDAINFYEAVDNWIAWGISKNFIE